MNRKHKNIDKSDKEWINGYFDGYYSGQEKVLMETIRILKKSLKKVRKQKKVLEVNNA